MTSGSSFVLLVFTMLRPREPRGKVWPVFRDEVRIDAEGAPSRLPGHLRAVTPSDQQRREPSERFGGIQRAQATNPGPSQCVGSFVFVSRIRQSGLDHVGSHPRGHQRAHDGSTARPLDLKGVIGDLARERLVVHEPHPLEPFEDVGDLRRREPRLKEAALQLPPTACSDGEQA